MQLRIVVFVAGLALVPASAAAGPADDCTAAKLRAAAKAAQQTLNCIRTALRKSEPVSAKCLAKVEIRLPTEFSRAEKKYFCHATGNDLATRIVIADFIASLNDLLLPTGASCSDPTACASGHCVDGVCCNVACDTPCLSCRASDTHLNNGLCAPIKYFGEVDASPTPLCIDNVGCTTSSCGCDTYGRCLGRNQSFGCSGGKECLSQSCFVDKGMPKGTGTCGGILDGGSSDSHDGGSSSEGSEASN